MGQQRVETEPELLTTSPSDPCLLHNNRSAFPWQHDEQFEPHPTTDRQIPIHSTALKQAYQILDRPLVKTALTDALERLGITFERILQPIVDGLEATVLVKNSQLLAVKKTSIPDVPVRLQAHDRAVALLGGVPNNVKPLEPKSKGLIVMFGAIKPGNEQEI